MLVIVLYLKDVDAMEAVSTNLYQSLKRYYNHLFNSGYSPKSNSEKLLILLFISELIDTQKTPSIYDTLILSREELTILERALHCLYGSSCEIKYPDIDCCKIK